MLDELVLDLEPLRMRDLIRVDGSNADALCGFIACVAGAIRSLTSGVVVNMFKGIERRSSSRSGASSHSRASRLGRYTLAPEQTTLCAPDVEEQPGWGRAGGERRWPDGKK